MKKIKQYSDRAYDYIADVSERVGARLPGSKEEQAFAKELAQNKKDIGLNPKTEKFMVAPNASIGGIRYIGWAGLVACFLVYFSNLTFLSFAICLACFVFLAVQIVLYKGWFDQFFKQEVSQNVYSDLVPEDGEYDYTVMLSAHMDTSWNWRQSAINPKMVYVKIGLGAVALVFLMLASLSLFIEQFRIETYQEMIWMSSNTREIERLTQRIENFYNFRTAMYVLPALIAPLLLFVTTWNDKNREVASPGAMDNLSGIAINHEIIKYYKENPSQMPKRCRLIDMNFGSEEAGLKGSMDFVKKHKSDGMLDNMYNINVDSIADKDHFEAITGDLWQFTNFDKEMIDMLMDSLGENGIEKPGRIKNPVGGCDSTPLHRVGVKTVTFAAQNPIATEYYHTYKDVAERFEPETIMTGMATVMTMIGKIEEKELGKRARVARKTAVLEEVAEVEEIVEEVVEVE